MKKGFVFLMIVVSMLLSGCYINREVKTNEVGVRKDNNRVKEVVGPGVYSDWGYFSDIERISIGAVTFSVEDPEVLTSDNQAIALKVTIQARRSPEAESVKNLVTNWPNLMKDSSLVDTISATAREGMKNGVRAFTLSTLLDDRNGLADSIRTQIEQDAVKYGVELINVTIENIGLDPAYVTTLNEKAQLRVQTEKELERQKLITQEGANNILQAQTNTKVMQEQLNVEKAKTDVEVEIASREGKKVAQANQVYITNQYAFELEKLRLLKDILGDKATVWFLQQGTDISLILNGQGQIVPIPTNP